MDGSDMTSNRALARASCNLAKSDRTTGNDPKPERKRHCSIHVNMSGVIISAGPKMSGR